MKKHVKTSPFLIGTKMPDDEIHEAKQKSWKIKLDNNSEQISFI